MTRKRAKKVTETVIQHARQMAEKCGAEAMVVCMDAFSSPEEIAGLLGGGSGIKTFVVTRDPDRFQESLPDTFELLEIPHVDLTRMGQIKMGVLLGLSRGGLHDKDRLICLSGVARSNKLDTILFTQVGEELEMFGTTGGEQLSQHGNPEVFEKVLDIAVELGQEGREGKPVGTIFVLGDMDRVKEFSEPLLLNPFQGHPEDQRNILAPSLRETMKELSALDGAFLVREDGVVEAAGVFLRSVIPGSVLPRGLGTRHRSAAAITAATKATAVTVSESTGNVTVFREGRILIEIEKPRVIGSRAPQPRDLVQKGGALEPGEFAAQPTPRRSTET
jgi:diadenylate cyclase